jgi:hypothetical protein
MDAKWTYIKRLKFQTIVCCFFLVLFHFSGQFMMKTSKRKWMQIIDVTKISHQIKEMNAISEHRREQTECVLKQWRNVSSLNNRATGQGPDDGVQHSGLRGFWTSSIVRYSKEHNVSETGSVSVQWLRLALSNGPNRIHVDVFPPHLRTGTDQVFYSLEYRMLDNVQKKPIISNKLFQSH